VKTGHKTRSRRWHNQVSEQLAREHSHFLLSMERFCQDMIPPASVFRPVAPHRETDAAHISQNGSARPPEKLSVIMPVFNERGSLREIVERVLRSAVPLEMELVAVDDCSTDGSWELLQRLADNDPRNRVYRHSHNRGKGAAVRTAIQHVSGDVAVIQDADLEYDPNDYLVLLEPVLRNGADAVFGSRFVGHPRRVLRFWHSLVNKGLTLLSNMVNDLTLTDMETCYKMVRVDILKQIRLKSDTFTIEPELTCRLAQCGARIYEVPISYSHRTVRQGKKIRAIDGLKALWAIVRFRFLDTKYACDSRTVTSRSGAESPREAA